MTPDTYCIWAIVIIMGIAVFGVGAETIYRIIRIRAQIRLLKEREKFAKFRRRDPQIGGGA